MTLDKFILEKMFEQSLFSDLSLAFYHSAFPSTMRFDVHRAIVAQSPFLHLILNNTHRINSVDHTHSNQQSVANSATSQQRYPNHSTTRSNSNSNTLHLTIDLIDAMTRRGFLMAPSQHIIRRQWQSPTSPPPTTTTTSAKINNNNNHTTRHILSSHLRFVLKWLYCTDRMSLVETLNDDDTLRVLCVAILFDLNTLVDACLERYTNRQLSINTIIGDLETICQLPRDHKAYHQLRDAALLLLLRYGPDHPQQLARLPVDYMSDVLSADVLFIGCEYERYRLLREVLVAFMQSVGKITWTLTGPLDQDHKRLSGFVHNSMFTQKQTQQQQQQRTSLVSLDGTSSTQKRKLDSSETLVNRVVKKKQQRLSRLCFSSRVPFEQLVEGASSGGVIDKATILSYLLRTTVNYSNMTFEQLSIVRQDGIVDEGIVFKALWQREALERLLFPFNYQQSQQAVDANISLQSPSQVRSNQVAIPQFGKIDAVNNGMGRQETTTDTSDDQEKVLLGAPQFRFSASVRLNLPSEGDHAGWDLATSDTLLTTTTTPATTSATSFGRTLSEQSQQSSNTVLGHSVVLDQEKRDISSKVGDNDNDYDDDFGFEFETNDVDALLNCDAMISSSGKEANVNDNCNSQQQRQHVSQNIYNKTIYTDAKYILGHWHRVRVEAQVLPRSLLQIQDDDEDDSGSSSNNNNRDESPVLVCRFELQRDMAAKHMASSSQHLNITHYQSVHPMISSQQHQQYNSQPQNSQRSTTTTPNDSQLGTLSVPSHYQEPAQQQSKIRYAIFCLNQHDGLMKNDQVDPEDRVLVPVSEVIESSDSMEKSTGYVGQSLLNTDALKNKKVIDVDLMVALEIFGFTNKCS